MLQVGAEISLALETAAGSNASTQAPLRPRRLATAGINRFVRTIDLGETSRTPRIRGPQAWITDRSFRGSRSGVECGVRRGASRQHAPLA